MKKKWKKLMAISCALTMFMTTPGMSVLADEMSAEEIIESVAEEPDAIEETWEMAESLDEEIEISEADSVDQEVQETGSWSDDHLVGAASTINSGSCGTSATWDLKDNGDLYIGGTGDMTNYENADKVPWKAYRSSIKKVIIGNGITSIGRNAFYGCSSLSDISFTATSKVKSIGGDAFTNCSKLKHIDLPKSAVHSFGGFIYCGCSSLELITGYCGESCTWKYDRSNATLTIDGSGRMYDYIYQISPTGFSQNTNLIDGTEANGFTPWFSFCEEIKKVNVCGNVTYIGQGAFGSLGSKWSNDHTKMLSNGGIESVTFSSSVTEFGECVFKLSGCTSTVEFPATKSGVPPQTGGTFVSVKLAEGYTSTGSAFSGPTLQEIYLPSTIKIISNSAFENCSNLSKISIPSKTTTIGRYAFSGCNKLDSITVPDTVTEIGTDAFRNCDGLKSVVFKGSLETLSSYVFYGCTSLKSITFPKNLKSIGVYCFYDCDALTAITVPEGVETIYGGAFNNCENLKSISLPASLTTLSYGNHNGKLNIDNSFHDNPSLEIFSVATGNTTFASYDGCIYNKNLTELLFVPTAKKEVLVPESVTTIGEFAFFNDEGYSGTSIHFRGNLTSSFPENVFENVTTTAYYPAGNSTWSQSAREKLGGSIVWKEWHPNIANCNITISPASYIYDGNAKKPAVTVKDGTTTLLLNTDYTLTYSDNVNPGKANVKVTGKGKYSGSKSIPFTINPASYTITFNANGGSVSTTSKNVTNGGTYGTLPTPTRSSYKFDGWYTSTSGGTKVTSSTTVNLTGNQTLYAHWTYSPASYTITFNANGGSVSTTSKTVTNGGTYGTLPTPTRSNYKFDGWYTSASGGTKVTSSTTVNLTGNQTLYAHWIAIYTVIYDANGGTGTPSPQQKEKNVSLTLSSTKPTKQYLIRYNSNGGSVSPSSTNLNCTFKSWNTAKNGTGTSYAPQSKYTANADVTLYAQWSNPKAGTLATPTRSGYVFTGWFTSATGGNLISSSSTISGNITLYAHWTDPYNLGDETYSFGNYRDSDAGGHCFGMSITSAGYMNNRLDITRIGGNSNTPLYSFKATSTVKQPICYYQKIQGPYSRNAIVAGGSVYLERGKNITYDWSEVVNYVKDHKYDGTGLLQIGFKKGLDGHAVNFLYYKNVNGQDRIYAYDNNFPGQETYFYRDSSGNVREAPIQTFNGAIDCIALRDIRIYFDNVKHYDSTHVIYVARDAATVQGYSFSYMDGEDYVMYEIPKSQDKVTIIPKKDNADFIYMDTEYSFGKITNNTRGDLTFSTLDENAGTTNERFVIYEDQSSSYKFSDVQDPSHPYYKAIYWAAGEGITKGYSDGTFGINRSCTRGEMMMFLWRYAGKQEPKTVSKSPFKDVPKTHTFYKAILWGSQKGITKGYSDGTFGVNRNVSRGECMMFLWRLKNKPAPKAVAKAPFPDVPKSHVFYNAVLWGYQKKITTGFTSGKLKGKFGVNENCSRGQIVTFLYRAK